MKHDITLGNMYREKVHGRMGIATAVCYYLTGCTQVCLERLDKDEKVVNMWIDITGLDEVKVSKEEDKNGGPQKHPPSRNN